MGLFGGGGGSSYVPPAPVEKDNTEEIKAAAERESERIRKMRGRASLIRTSGAGLTDVAAIFKSKLGA